MKYSLVNKLLLPVVISPEPPSTKLYARTFIGNEERIKILKSGYRLNPP